MEETKAHQRRRRGFTLVGSVSSLTVVIVSISSLTIGALTLSGAQRGRMIEDLLAAQAQRAVDFIAAELAAVEWERLDPRPVPPLSSHSIAYRPCQGWAEGERVLGPRRRIRTVLEEGELADGLDNNGNGLVDERRVVWTEAPETRSERSVVHSHWVRNLLEGELPNGRDDNGNGLIDEPGLAFSADGETIRVMLSLEIAVPGGEHVVKTVESRVRVQD